MSDVQAPAAKGQTASAKGKAASAKASNPYRGLPDHCFWSRAHRGLPRDVDPVVEGTFTITPEMKIATAGSCFAQHVARYLSKSGYNYFVPEAAHPVISQPVAQAFNYGTFSARYGNIYTTRQLLQLAQRARGEFTPRENVWRAPDGHFIDPFRPQIQPGGFSRQDDFLLDRDRHFAAVRRIMDESDVFVFTFGLTEAWRSKVDGAVFPLAPGVAGGTFDPERHEFHNFSVDEIVADFTAFVSMLRLNNPKVKVLMTVSPVPLIATARERESVIAATAYSKAVLRVAVEQLRGSIEDCHYFPSYEVVTGISTRGRYFADDLREVRPAGVQHAMGLFMRHYTDQPAENRPARKPQADRPAAKPNFQEEVESALQVICDEEAIEKAL